MKAKCFLSAKWIALAPILTAGIVAARSVAPFDVLPLYFEDASAEHFVARGNNCEFQIAPTGSQILLRKTPTEIATVQMQFIGANPSAQISGSDKLPGTISYFDGSDKSQWRSGIPMFAKVRIAKIYPGIDLVYYGNAQQLEYDFIVAPEADPDSIRLHFDGVDKVSVNAVGELTLNIGRDQIIQRKPLIYQTVGGERKEIAGNYKILGKDTVAFSIGQFDRNLPLVIDPVLNYSTFFGGDRGELAWSVAVDDDGFVYVAGETFSTRLTKNAGTFSTPGAFQTNFQGGKLTGDAFVAKFDNTLTNLIYCTYLGGIADDGAFSIAVDTNGDAFITGFTASINFPTTPDALFGNIGGGKDLHTGVFPVDAFVTVLDPSGSNLLYSTYLGGTGADAGTGIALDSAGDIYLTGITGSRDFPITNALLFQLSGTTNTTLDRLAGTNNAFVTEIAADGSALIFSTYFGGKKFDEGESIAVDGGGYIYVAGFTESTNFPTINAFQPKLNRGSKKISAKGSVDNDAFVAKFNPSGAGLVYSTFLGGTNKDTAFDIATDGAGNAYITGSSASLDFWNTNTMTSASGTNVIPGLRSALTQKNGSSTDAFLTKLDPNGVLIYSVLFGGKTNDFGYGVVVDSAGDAFVVGATASTNFPVFVPIGTSGFPSPTVNATKKNKGFDSFVTAVKADATGLLYSLYVGGRGNDFCYGIAIDAAANVYMVGQTTSTNFPTVNAFQTTIHGTNDTFLLKIEP